MTNNHPITPPVETLQHWIVNAFHYNLKDKFIEAARWGADAELEACCEWLDRRLFDRDEIRSLRAARRPKQPSLKEQALAELDLLKAGAIAHGLGFDASAIHNALNQLSD